MFLIGNLCCENLPVSSAFIPKVLFYPGSIETGGTSVDFENRKKAIL